MTQWVLVFYSVFTWGQTGITAVVPMADQDSCLRLKIALTSDKKDRGSIDTMLECRDLVAHPLKLKTSR